MLRGYCAHGGNKSAAAAAVRLPRSAYYKLLARIEQHLGVSLGDPESVLSPHTALLALDSTRRRDPANATIHRGGTGRARSS